MSGQTYSLSHSRALLTSVHADGNYGNPNRHENMSTVPQSSFLEFRCLGCFKVGRWRGRTQRDTRPSILADLSAEWTCTRILKLLVDHEWQHENIVMSFPCFWPPFLQLHLCPSVLIVIDSPGYPHSADNRTHSSRVRLESAKTMQNGCKELRSMRTEHQPSRVR